MLKQNRGKIGKILLLILIIFIGIALRAQEAISNNFLFLIDQGRDMQAVRDIVFNHKLTLIGPYTSLQGVFQGPLWYYLLSIPTFITNGDPRGGVILMLVISISVLFAVYFFMNKIFGEKEALISLFLFAVSPEAIAAATYTWNPHPMWILIVLYIFFFYFLISKKIKFNLFVWPLIGLMFNFQTALAVFILLSTFIYLTIFNRKLIFNKYFLIGITLFGFTLLPQILFDLRHNFLMSKSVISLFTGSKQGLFVGGENTGYYNLIRNHISVFHINFNSSFIRINYLNLPNIFMALIILVLLFSKRFNIFSVKENTFILMIVRLVFIVVLLSFLYPFPIRYWFLTGFQSFYLLLFGLIFSKILNYKIGKIVLLLFFSLLIFNSGQRIYTLYINPPDDGGVAKIKGKIAAIDYLYKDANGKKFGLLVFNPPVYTYAYDYLIWWYGERKYNYIPNPDKKGEFYLLIEPDPAKVWSYKGWLETVIKTGKIVYTKELPSGFIIQKRIE